MQIYLTKDIPDNIVNQISKYFMIGSYNAKNLYVTTGKSKLSDVLIQATILDEAECLFQEDIKYSPSISTIRVTDTVLAVTLKIDVQNSMDIDFIFKPHDTEIIFKDALHWKSFYFFKKRELHDCGNIYEDVDPDIISYLAYGQYVHEGIEGALDESLIELYRKGEQNFKNLLLLKDMIKI